MKEFIGGGIWRKHEHDFRAQIVMWIVYAEAERRRIVQVIEHAYYYPDCRSSLALSSPRDSTTHSKLLEDLATP